MIQVSLEESTPFCLFSTNHHITLYDTQKSLTIT